MARGDGHNQAPVASMVSPSQNITVRPEAAVNLEGTASDPDGHLPLTYRWSTTPGSGVTDRQSLSPGSRALRPRRNVPGDLDGDRRARGVVHDDPHRDRHRRTAARQDGLGAEVRRQSGDCGRTTTVQPMPSMAIRTPCGRANGWPLSRQSPHDIQIDLGATRDVVGFRYLPRQDGFTSGNIGRYEFYVSADGTNWGAAVATGIFSPDATEKEVAFALKSGRYVRLRALSEVNRASLHRRGRTERSRNDNASHRQCSWCSRGRDISRAPRRCKSLPTHVPVRLAKA